MHPTHLKAKRPTSLRMFPRLAQRPTCNQTVTRRRVSVRPHPVAAVADKSVDEARADLRLRLLKMIIQNEQARRNEPDAS
jgi:hypothetical protein